ncbi:hypothetical protein AWC20_19350 [Mycobacterium parmense]|nr:hypothetical protein AWC20_19350 [Mycobacterium parmense]
MAHRVASNNALPKAVSRRGWRRWAYRLTGVNFGLSGDEKYQRQLEERIRRKVRGSYQIAVVGLKGGAGKTAVAVALASTFARIRGDRILAVDANPVAGNLADRVGRQSRATVADLLTGAGLSNYNDVRAHTSVHEFDLEVLSAAEYGAARGPLTEEEWRCVVGTVPRYYNLVLADCGTDLLSPATRAILATASGVVLVSSASADGIGQAALALDWLRLNGYQALLGRACVAINQLAPANRAEPVDHLVRRFEAFVAPERVIVLPWDEHVAAGAEIRSDQLGDAYKRKMVELAAALSDDFDRGDRR